MKVANTKPTTQRIKILLLLLLTPGKFISKTQLLPQVKSSFSVYSGGKFLRKDSSIWSNCISRIKTVLNYNIDRAIGISLFSFYSVDAFGVWVTLLVKHPGLTLYNYFMQWWTGMYSCWWNWLSNMTYTFAGNPQCATPSTYVASTLHKVTRKVSQKTSRG